MSGAVGSRGLGFHKATHAREHGRTFYEFRHGLFTREHPERAAQIHRRTNNETFSSETDELREEKQQLVLEITKLTAQLTASKREAAHWVSKFNTLQRSVAKYQAQIARLQVRGRGRGLAHSTKGVLFVLTLVGDPQLVWQSGGYCSFDVAINALGAGSDSMVCCSVAWSYHGSSPCVVVDRRVCGVRRPFFLLLSFAGMTRSWGTPRLHRLCSCPWCR